MPSKENPHVSAVVSVKKLLLELETDSTSFVTLRVKPDRRQSTANSWISVERRAALRPAFSGKPVSK